MEIFGVIPDIPVFEGARIPVSRHALTPGTRPLQFLLAPDFDFSVRYETDAMRGFQNEVDLNKARAGESSTDASIFWDLLDPPMQTRVIAAGFGDYASRPRRIQPRFPLAMRYALMERWNDCTHSFIFGFGEMTLTPADYTAITGLRFDGDVVPLDARYRMAALGAELMAILLGVTTHARFTAQGYVSYEVVYKFWAEQIRARLAAWRELPEYVRPAAPTYTREERDKAARSFMFYIISSQLLCTSQNKGDPAVLVCLRDLSLIGTYDWASPALAHLYHGLDVWTRGSGESNWLFFLPLELFLNPWEGDAWTSYAPRVRAEALTGSRILLRGYRLDRYYLGERFLEIHIIAAQRRVPVDPPCHMCTLEGMTLEEALLEYGGFPADDFLGPGDYASYLSTRLMTRLPNVREYSQERRRHRTPAFYRAQVEADVPAEPMGIVPGDVPFPPGMEVALDPALGLGQTLIIPADIRQVPPQLQLDPERATHVSAQRYQELYRRFYFARAYIAKLYSEHHEMELENNRLQRHQIRQSARLQREIDRLRTRLEVEGILLDSLDEDDDNDDSPDEAPPPPSSSIRRAVVGPSRRRR
ncbi:hypothetical protein JCGZ_20090 [Jatropha curcas]|uniref:Aminotransferase-like plant mobile domain-containing protein n=1 Tax=Jatropha curcas TaxID=180498 RepID=A0A067JUI4_JATCU|nr:hypothetical protein JCGZ_20090 [Jatropha curcas]